MRWTKSGAAPRLFVCLLLVVYGALFVVLQRMEPDPLVHHEVVRVPNPLAFVSKDVPSNDITKDEAVYPIPPNWKHGLGEGRVDVFLKDLWEYTNLPGWMKGKTS